MPSSRGGGGGGGGGSSSNNSSSGRSSRLRIHASPPRALAVGEACQSIIDIYIYIERERELKDMVVLLVPHVGLVVEPGIPKWYISD